MIWVDREVKKIKERKSKLEWIDDMWTPSGKAHLGSLRGIIIHDLTYKVLLENDVKTKFTYVFDDQDPMDGIPFSLDQKKWKKYMGLQLYKIPSPEPGFKSFAEYYSKEFVTIMKSLNCHPKIIYGSELYLSGKMNGVIKEVLDNADKVRKIYKKIANSNKSADWFPYNVACEKCGKIGTTLVYKWNGKEVYYRCEKKLVSWAEGCKYSGSVSPYNGHGKIPWKVEWACKWKVIGVTIEGAGKDHMSAGGSHDISSSICNDVINYPVPYPLPYEYFTIGGKKMASSKGIGVTAKEMTEIIPAELLRFFVVRSPINTAIEFNPYGDTILNLFDDYDRCLNAYFDKLENKIPEGKPGEVLSDFARIAELSAVRPLPDRRMFLPRFRTIVNLVKNKTNLLQHFEIQKGKLLTADEKETLEEREMFVQKYLDEYVERVEEETTQQPTKVSLNKQQRKFLNELADALGKQKKADRDTIQNVIFDVLKKGRYQASEIFPAFYQVLTGQLSGPKAADLIIDIGLNRVVKHFKKIIG